MSIVKCINSAVSQGVISQQDATNLQAQVLRMTNAHLAGGATNPVVAQAMAVNGVAGRIREQAALKKLRVVRQTQAQLYLQGVVDNAADVRTSVDALFSPDYRSRVQMEKASLEYRIKHISDIAKSPLADSILHVQKSMGDITPEFQRLAYDELLGKNTGNQVAKQLADGIKKSLEYVTDRYRMNGGAVGKIADFDIPHAHSQIEVARTGKDGWVSYVTPMLDRTKMLDRDGLPLGDVELKTMLEGVWETIRTGGLKNDTSTFQTKGSTANYLDHERVLNFKDDGWFEYNNRFGKNDVVNTAINHIGEMSRKIGLMEIFGPNAELGKEFLKTRASLRMLDVAQAQANAPLSHVLQHPFDSLFNNSKSIGGVIDGWYDIATGKAFGISDSTLSRWCGNIRQWLTSAQLGSALLSASGDFATLGFTAKYNGLPQAKLAKNYLRGLFDGKNPEEARVLAGTLGLQMDHLMGAVHVNREFNDGNNVSKHITDTVMRASGLTQHTDAGRVAFMMSMSNHIAENFGKDFDNIPMELHRGLHINGITPAEWDIIRASTPINHNGELHINLAEMERMEATHTGASEAAVKLHQYLHDETDHALIASGWKFERVMQGTIGATGVRGELAKFAAMYKRYPVLMMYNIVGRMMSEQGGGVMHGVGLSAALTVCGAVSLSLVDIAAGRDPRSWDTPGFWTDAFIKGGAGGPLTDFTKQFVDSVKQQRYTDAGSVLTSYVVGPVYKMLGDVFKPLHDGVVAGVKSKWDEKTTLAAFNDTFLRNSLQYVPGSTLWYIRAAYQRMVSDGLTQMFDPNSARARFRAAENSRMQNYDKQKFWWRPGHAMPDRMPDYGSNG